MRLSLSRRKRPAVGPRVEHSGRRLPRDVRRPRAGDPLRDGPLSQSLDGSNDNHRQDPDDGHPGPAFRCGSPMRRGGGFGAPIGVSRPLRQACNQTSPSTSCCLGIGRAGGGVAVTAAVGGRGAVACFQSTAACALSHTAAMVSPESMNSGTPVCSLTAARNSGVTSPIAHFTSPSARVRVGVRGGVDLRRVQRRRGCDVFGHRVSQRVVVLL